MKSWLGLLLALAVPFASGCGKSDSEKFADAYCGEFAKCCAQAGLPSDGSLCRVMMSGGSYNATAGDACLAEMRSEVAAGTFCASQSSSSACDSVFTSSAGNKKPGEACSFDSDCAASSEGKVVCASLYVNSAFIDKCQVQIPGKAGDSPCVGTQEGNTFMSYQASGATDVVPRGYACDVANGVQCKLGTCVALADVGGGCTYTSDCVRAAFCDNAKNQCASRVAAGGTCTGVDSAECMDGYYCPTSSPSQCTAKAAIGTQCGSSAMCQSDYCSSSTSTCQSNGLDTLGLAMLCGS